MTPEILFENDNIIVCIKPAGITSEDSVKAGMPTLLETDGKKPYVVHRLDKEVSGVMVFAKTSVAAAKLSKQISNGLFKKQYVAIVEGEAEHEARLEDLLFHDRRLNKTYVVKRQRNGVKKAALKYICTGISEFDGKRLSFLNIDLETGRTHQIRVQFASRKMPIVGDRKYGSSFSGAVALMSKSVSFINPENNKQIEFSLTIPDTFPWNIF